MTLQQVIIWIQTTAREIPKPFYALWDGAANTLGQSLFINAVPVSPTNGLNVIDADNQAVSQTINAGSIGNNLSVPLVNGRAVFGVSIVGLTASTAQLTVYVQKGDGQYAAKMTTAGSSVITADGQFRVDVGGESAIKLQVTTAGSGTITIAYSASAAASVVTIEGGVTATLGGALPAGVNQIGMTMPQIGAAVAPFTATTADQAITGLTLPGKLRIQFPLYQIGTASTPNVGQVQINYAGGNSLTAPTAMLLPGETDDWIVVTGTTAPHVSCPAGSGQIVIQQ